MKQISFLSGKGGTGKTSICAALIILMAQEHSLTLVDADVDASNLDLLIPCKKQMEQPFFAGQQAIIDSEKCDRCGKCRSVCRFNAIHESVSVRKQEPEFFIEPSLCEGCASCVLQCQRSAIFIRPKQDGIWYRSHSEFGIVFHAHLFAGHENSGKLVSTIISFARHQAEENKSQFVIIDGPPGIGCPVTAVCNHSDAAILVIEPTPSGIHDMLRIQKTAAYFQIQTFLIINKYDLHLTHSEEITEVCHEKHIPILGKIPFDPQFNDAVNHAQPITIFAPTSISNTAIQEVWHNLKQQAIFSLKNTR